MKNLKYVILIAVLALAIGCGIIQLKPVTTAPDSPVCEQAGFEDSWICTQLKANGIEYAETARDIILDANDIGILMEAYTADQARKVCSDLKACLADTTLTYSMFFDLVMENTEKAERLASILQRRFIALKSVEIIRESDRRLLMYAVEAVEASL